MMRRFVPWPLGLVLLALAAGAGCSRSPAGPSALERATSVTAMTTAAEATPGSPAAPDSGVPGSPQHLTSAVNGTTVTLTWSAPALGPSPLAYIVEAGSAPAHANLAILDTGSTATTLTVPGVPPATYYVRVRARTAAGAGAVSNEAAVTVGGSPTAPPVLSMTIVDLSGVYDPASARLGHLNCTYRFAADPNDRWCFAPFGTHPTPGRIGRAMQFKVNAASPVRAATAGTVVAMVPDELPDLYPGEFEIRTQPHPGSAYLVIYHHVRQPRVAVGSTVAPGDTLGVAGVHRSDAANVGRTELQIVHYPTPGDLTRSESVCPQSLGTPSFRAAHEAALSAHNAANPAFAQAAACAVERTP